MKAKLVQGHYHTIFCASTLFTTALCVFLLGESVIANDDSSDQERLSKVLVQTENGPVQGIIKKSRSDSVEFVSFLGLRYASQAARFEPPKPLKETWSTPKLANLPGNECPQISYGGKWPQNDDCLFVNVHVPKSHLEDASGALKPLPVLVWIHGGGFAFGDGYSYGAEYFMETEDVILVTINYRLGVLGFISMGSEDNAFTANNGLRDSVMALKWVQQNIAAFKGNPGKVTISGNSAGSAAVHYLLMSPLAAGLFHGAIMQSGAFSFWSYAQNPRKDALQLATFLDCPDNDEPMQIRKCLEGKSVKDLLIAQATFKQRWPPNNPITRFLPTAQEPKENAFFSEEPSSFFTFHGKSSKYISKVPVMAGIVRDEGSTLFTAFVLAEDKLLSQLNVNWDRLAPKTFNYEGFFSDGKLSWISQRLRDYYFGKAALTNDSVEFLSTLYTDSLFLLPVMQAAGDMANKGISVWPYVFSYLGNWSIRDGLHLAEMPGTIGHSDELQYLFPHSMLGHPLEPDSDSEKFSRRFVKFWTYFVQNGKPNPEWFEGEPLNWKPINAANSVPKFDLLRINSDPKVVQTLEFIDRLKFWRKTLREATGKPKSDKETKQEL